VSQVVFLDSGPLGLLTHPQRTEEVIAVADWLSRWLLGGNQVVVPAIVYYELKRELLRAKKAFGIGRLDSFINATPGRYLALTDEALKLAAELWARSRQDGRPTADSKALDIDVLIAAQALSFHEEVIIAPANA
jgi:predicted nucleic acid-binding protein